MKVNLALGVQNQKDWPRVLAGDWTTPPQPADSGPGIEGVRSSRPGRTAWFRWRVGGPALRHSLWDDPQPDSLGVEPYVAGPTEHISLGTMVLVLPWWNPVQCADEIAYLDILSKGRFDTPSASVVVWRRPNSMLLESTEKKPGSDSWKDSNTIRRALSGPRESFARR